MSILLYLLGSFAIVLAVVILVVCIALRKRVKGMAPEPELEQEVKNADEAIKATSIDKSTLS